jgi:hypothetical protein
LKGRATPTNVLLLALGSTLACCWFPRGISGLLSLARMVSLGLRPPEILAQLLQLWSDPLEWYALQLLQRFHGLSPRVLVFLSAVPNCLCGLVAVAIILVTIALVARASDSQGAAGPE